MKLGNTSIGMLKLGELNFSMLKLDELGGEVSFGKLKLVYEMTFPDFFFSMKI